MKKNKKILSITSLSITTLFAYSKLIEKRSLSSFMIESMLKINKFLAKNSSKDDFVTYELKKSINDSEKRSPLPIKYVSTDVYDFYFDDMQVISWNDDKKTSQKIIFYIHGGGYVASPLSFHYKAVDKIAKKTNAKVIFPIYPKVPRASYKDAFPKILNLYKKLLDEVKTSKQIILMGDSAGGGLALGLSLLLKEENIPQPSNIILLSPWLDISNKNIKIKEIKKYDPTLSQAELKVYADLWSENVYENQLVSPIIGDPHNLGKISIFSGTHEIFYPDILDYHETLVSNKIEHNFFLEPRMNHVYVLFPIPEAKKAIKQIIEIINDN